MERSEAEAIYAQGREAVVDVLLALSARLEAQDAQLRALAERVEDLEQRLKRDSRNSSLPPSHDPPWLGKRGRSRGTGRKQGGQLGHVGHGRSLFPIERVTEIVEHWPARCGCGHVFGADEREPRGASARHQVAELPPLAVEISEHRLQRVWCPDCGRTVRAELPAGVPRACFGPKLEAAIAALTVRDRLSRRQIIELMEELFGCPIAVGTVDAILTRTAETLAPVYDELLERTRAASALNIDETGWYLSGEPRTLWGAFGKQTAVLRIAPDRGKQHLHGLIGDEFAGIVGSDRFSAYNSLEPERRQVCWSHLRRDFTFHADLGLGAQETFGLDGLEVTWNVFHAWRQFQQDGDRAALQRQVAAIKTQMLPLLEWGSTGKRQRHVRALAKNLLKLWPALWTFADVPDVEPGSAARSTATSAKPSPPRWAATPSLSSLENTSALRPSEACDHRRWMSDASLEGKVALVTGASRGGGKGIACVLGERGATVYVTGRSVRGQPTTLGRPGTIDDTAEEVTARGGTGIALRCDHADDAQVEALFDRIRGEQGRLDVLVNNAWSGYEISPSGDIPFWEIEWRHWDLMFSGGLRAAAFASTLAAPLMIEAGSGLIVNITWVLDRPHGHAWYEVVKNATNKMTEQMADDLRPFGIACVAVSPGFMRLERMDLTPELAAKAESAEFPGRAIAALASDPDVLTKSGGVYITPALAREYGFTDVDGKQQSPFWDEHWAGTW